MRVLLFFAFSLLAIFADEAQLIDSKFKFISYAQVSSYDPGFGVSFRAQEKHTGLQADLNTTISTTSLVLQTSIGALYYPVSQIIENPSYGGFNIGVSLGPYITANQNLITTDLSIPYYAGYQGEVLFFDFSLNSIFSFKHYPGYGEMISFKALIPTLKLGFCF